MNQNQIIIFTDGSSSGNPGPGGWGTIIACQVSADAHDCSVVELGGHEDLTTNNRMELTAVIAAADYILNNSKEGSVTIHTDSSYVIQGITKWVKGWISKGWITSTKEPVSNRDLWENLNSLVEKIELKNDITWKQIKGHAGIPGNERADVIATAFTANQNPQLFNGPQSRYPVNLFVTTSNRTDKIIKDSKKNKSSQKAYSYISMISGEIKTHSTWAECESRVKGAKSARFKKSFSDKDEKSIIEEFRKGL